MRLSGSKVLITGGAGGIGRAVAAALLERGCEVLLADRDEAALRAAVREVDGHAGRVDTISADLAQPEGRTAVVERARHWRGGIDVLINAAGLNHFRLLEDQSAAQIDAAVAVNVLAPIHLCRQLLPHLRSRARAAILNVGSVFGAIGYPGYAAYAATKFALRGFSEALRRELAGSTVHVHYLAPRATRTPINPAAVERMNAELGVAMDPPERVAAAVVTMLERDAPCAVVGWPEKLFTRINALLPRLVDSSIRRQLPIIVRHARGAATPVPSPNARPVVLTHGSRGNPT